MSPAESDVAPAGSRLLWIAATLVLLAGVPLFLFPGRTEDWFAWTIGAPMTAVFLGASFWSATVLEIHGARATNWATARLSVWSVFVFTSLTLGVTLVHLDKFHLGAAHATAARLVAWGWVTVYAVVPVLFLLVVRAQARTARPRVGVPRVPLAAPLRRLLIAVAACLGAVGVALLLAPTAVGEHWPWPLTPLTGRAVGAWLVGLGWAAGQAAWADDRTASRGIGFTGVAFVALQAVALLRYGDALSWSSWAAWAWLGLLIAITVAALGLLGGFRQVRHT